MTPVMDDIVSFHDFLLYLITGIAGFVLLLLLIVLLLLGGVGFGYRGRGRI